MHKAEEPRPDLGVAEGSEEQTMEMPSWKVPEDMLLPEPTKTHLGYFKMT